MEVVGKNIGIDGVYLPGSKIIVDTNKYRICKSSNLFDINIDNFNVKLKKLKSTVGELYQLVKYGDWVYF